MMFINLKFTNHIIFFFISEIRCEIITLLNNAINLMNFSYYCTGCQVSIITIGGADGD